MQPGAEELLFVNLRTLTLLLAKDLVLLLSLCCDLQTSPEQFAAECEALKLEAIILRTA